MVAVVASVYAVGSEADIEDGESILVTIGSTASGASPTLLLGQLGALPIVDSLGTALPAGALRAGTTYVLWKKGDSLVLPGGVSVNVTATANGLTTALVPANASWVTITSANAAHIVTLPPALAGMKIEAWVGANGCELETALTSNETINNVDSDGSTKTTAIPATTLLRLNAVAGGVWVLQILSELAAVITPAVPD